MRKLNTLAVFIGIEVLFVSPILASSFRCTIIEVMNISENGDFVEVTAPKHLIEDQMIVDTDSGKVFHPSFGNTYYPNVEILDQGGETSSFKLLAMSNSNFDNTAKKEFRNVFYLTIKTWSQGRNKPFLVTDNSSIASGVCQ